MTTSYSAEYRAQVAMTDETRLRTLGRRLSLTAMITDGVVLVYLAIWLCMGLTFVRLNFYQPQMMRPFNPDFPFWRIALPVFLFALPATLCMMLVWYRIAAIFIVYLIVVGAIAIWGGVCIAYLIADWISCSDRLWCTCLSDYTFNAGIITTVACASGNGASELFIAFFWLFIGCEFYIVFGLLSLGAYFHFGYAHTVHAEDAYNPGRVLIGDELNIGDELIGSDIKKRSQTTGKFL